MSKIKKYCENSLLLVIYHTDRNDEKCVKKQYFFEANLHFSDGQAKLRPLCAD